MACTLLEDWFGDMHDMGMEVCRLLGIRSGAVWEGGLLTENVTGEE